MVEKIPAIGELWLRLVRIAQRARRKLCEADRVWHRGFPSVANTRGLSERASARIGS